jgi:hypothetical protein
LRLALAFALGVKGCGGVFNNRNKTSSSRLRGFGMASQIWWPLHHTGIAYSSHMPLDSNPEYARALGSILERWTGLESTLARALACVLEIEDRPARAVLYSLNSTSNRIGIVRSVTQEMVPEGPEKRCFVHLLDKINDLQKRRNELIHGEYWHGDKDKLDLVLIRPMNKKPLEIQPIQLAQLQEHANKVEAREIQLSLAIDPEPQNNMPNTYWQIRNEQLQKNWFHEQAMAKSRGEPPPPRPTWRR